MAVTTADVVPTLQTAPSAGERLRAAGRYFRSLLREPTFTFGLVVLAGLVLLCVFAQQIAPYDPAATNTHLGMAAPSAAHLMGTDQLGRDVFSRVVHGSRLSLSVAIGVVAISAGGGTLLGLVTGYVRGVLDTIVMRLMDVLLAFPGLVLALVAAAILGTGIRSVIIAVGIAGIPRFARVTRGAVLSAATEDYVTSARAVGCTSWRVMFRHVLPNVTGPILILASLYLAFAVLTAASLSFLGVGVQPPTAEWGAMANQGRNVIVAGWWVSLFPSLMVLLFVLAINLMGDVLRDRLDVELRSRSAV
jgi:peptide/nickel transport system permease protein